MNDGQAHGESALLAEARDQAIATAGEMVKHNGDTVWNGSTWTMKVTDEAEAAVFTPRPRSL